MQGKHGHLSREQKQLALRLHAKGWRLVDIAKEIGCSAPMVGIMARTGRHVDAKPFGWEPRQGNLTIDEREQILLGINRGDTFTAIAEQLGRAVSTGLACARTRPPSSSPTEAIQARVGSAA